MAYLGLNIIFSLYRTDGLSLIAVMLTSASLIFLLSIWQGHKLFSRNLLWRHGYLLALGVVEIAVMLCYWYVFDDPSAKSLLITLILYLCWGTLELESSGGLKWNGIKGFIGITVLLVIFVLVTMKPTIDATIH